MTIKNREEIVEQLTDMLIHFDKDCNNYQTDVYLYYDEENQTAQLDTFVNVGGNSWLDDDHYTIYSDREHFSDMWDWFSNAEEIANYLEIPVEQFRKEVIAFLEISDDEAEDFELDHYEARRYAKTKDEYMEKLFAIYCESIDELRPDYVIQAEEIIERFENEEA